MSAQPWVFSHCRATSQEYWSAAQPQPCPRSATDAVEPGLNLQNNFLAWPHNCLIPTNLPDDLQSWLILPAISWFASLGYQGTRLAVLRTQLLGLCHVKSSQTSLLPHTYNQKICFLAGNQKTLTHAFQLILNTKYASWR